MARSTSEFTSFTCTQLRELYEKNPQDFAELADAAIRKACIGRTPEITLQLKQLQWTIDAQMLKAKTPQRRLQIMEGIFYDQVFGDNGSLAQIRSGCLKIARTVARGERVSGCRPRLHLVKK